MKDRILVALLLCGLAVVADTQNVPAETSPRFVFVSVAQARAILGARDDFTLATAPLERAARVKSAEPVSEDRLMRHLADAALEWTDAERRRLDPLLVPLA